MEKPVLTKDSKGFGLFATVLSDMVNIFSAVSNEDSIRIFFTAREGIASSTKTIQELGLTQKRYYARLNELLKAGLLQKEDNVYCQTMLGKLCYKLGEVFAEALTQSEKLELIDKVRKFQSVETCEKDKIIRALMKDELANSFSLSSFLTAEDLMGVRKVMKVVDTYDDLVKIVAECYDKAEKEIKIASRYTPSEVAEKVQHAIARGIKMEWVDGDRANISVKLQIVKMVFMNPKAAINFYQAVNNPNSELKFYKDLPFCLMIVDGKFGALEIPNPLTGEFLFAIFFEDQDLCEKLNIIFNDLKEKAVEHPYKELANKFSKIGL